MYESYSKVFLIATDFCSQKIYFISFLLKLIIKLCIHAQALLLINETFYQTNLKIKFSEMKIF